MTKASDDLRTRRERASSAPVADHEAPPVLAVNDVCDGRYRIVRFIDRGGMGEVYEARDVELGATVALKLIRPEIAADALTLERFKREIHLARQVTHPNVSRIFDLGKHALPNGDELHFLTMELIDGESLEERIGRGKLAIADAMPIARQVAGAIDAAHAKGIIHRDLKPGNVMLATDEGGTVRAIVTDFGVARTREDPTAGVLTGRGDILGSPAYMAPEQVEGAEVTAATDIYSFGVIVYEMVTGVRPFRGDTTLATAAKRLKQDPPPPRNHVPDLDQRWNDVILQGLAREPGDRFATATAMVDALGAPARPRWRRYVFPIWMAAAVALGGFAIATRHGASGTPNGGPAISGRPPVAILGFKNLSGHAEADWLSTAIAEMLRTELAVGDRVRLVPGEVVARAKLELSLVDELSHSRETLARIRSSLGTDYVITGSYVAIGEGADAQLRLDLRLEDAAAGEVVASISQSGSEGKLFALVSEAGAAMREKLGAPRLSERQAVIVRASLPADPQAAKLYAEGLAQARRGDALGARDLLLRAIAIDAKHPMIHASLARVWSTLGYEAKAGDEAARAYEHTAELAPFEQRSIEALYHETRHDWDAALAIDDALVRDQPDDLERALQLATTQIAASRAKDALTTVAAMRALPAPSSSDARIDLVEANAANRLGDYSRMADAAARAIADAEARGARKLLAEAWNDQAASHWRLGRNQEALAATDHGKTIADQVGDDYQRARSIALSAAIKGDLGDHADAARLNAEALALHKKIGNQTGAAKTLNNMGTDLADEGDLDGAREKYTEALAIARDVGDREQQLLLSLNLSDIARLRGDLAEAQQLLTPAIAAAVEMGERHWQATGESQLGETLFDGGQLDAAAKQLADAQKINRELGRKRDQAEVARAFGVLAITRDHLDEARAALAEASALATELGERWDIAQTAIYQAVVAIEARDPEGALKTLATVVTELDGKPADMVAFAHALRARALVAAGRAREAEQELAHPGPAPSRIQLRFGIGLATARTQLALGQTAQARASLAAIEKEAKQRGFVGAEFEAQLALGTLNAERAHKLGYDLLARQVKAAVVAPPNDLRPR